MMISNDNGDNMCFETSEKTRYEKETAKKITDLYSLFRIKIGPLIRSTSSGGISRFEFELDSDTILMKIIRMKDDIALNLDVPKVRLICPIYGRSAFAIELPNGEDRYIDFDEIFFSTEFTESKDKLCAVLGKSVFGENICLELSKAPNVLIGGLPGSGKTALLNNILVSLICSNSPSELKILLVTPQKHEFELFEKTDLLLESIICEESNLIDSLKKLCTECDRRYSLFEDNSVRNIDQYNAKTAEPLERIVVVVDSFLFTSQRKMRDFETAVCRLLAKGRATGIHVVLATNDLSSTYLTGIIKANITTRIALSTKNGIDSRAVIDSLGAENLMLGGDMLYCDRMLDKPLRVQAAYLTKNRIQEKLNGIIRQ